MPINKRKPVGRKDRGNYPRQKLIDAVLDVISGKISSAAHASKQYKIPARTVRRWVKRGKDALKELLAEEPQVFEMRDYYGPDRGLCRDDEDLLKLFLEEAESIGIPRCRARFAVDIQEHVRQKNLLVPFKNDKPGRGFFDRFCSDVDGWPITIMTGLQVNNFMDHAIELDEWILQVRDYVKQKHSDLICDRKLVFVVESQGFKTATHPSRDLTVVVIYNGLGEILRWIIVTDGSQLSDDFALQHGPQVMLLKTENGHLTPTTVMSIMILIRREMTTVDMTTSALVYLDVFLSQEVNFIVWNYCYNGDIDLMAIPRKIFWSMKPFKIGAMAKYSGKMLFYMYHRFINIGVEMTEENFVHVHQQIVGLNFQRHLTTSISFLKLNSVVKKKTTTGPQEFADTSPAAVVPVPSSGSSGNEPAVKKSKGKSKAKSKCKKCSKEPIGAQCIATDSDDLIMLHEDIGTQTLETNFVQEQLHSMIRYMMNTIRIEDFKSEYD